LHVEAALTDALVDEAAEGVGSLPLLSTALVELWQSRSDRWLRMPAYLDSGGIHGAVSRLAEASYAALNEDEKLAARRVMLRLSVTGDSEVLTRRQVGIDEFDLDRDHAAQSVIERFTEDRLLTAEGDTIEVAHEALLRDWPRLGQWLSEDMQGRAVRQHVTQAARAWQASGREPSELYRGARLTATMDWAAEHATDLNEVEREFLAASRQAADEDASAQRRTNRRLRSLLSGVAILLVLALIAGVLALVQRSSAQSSARHARTQATQALAQSLAAQAIAQPRIDLAMLLARESVALNPSLQIRSDLLTTMMRVPTALRTYHLNRNRNNGLFLSPDGKTLAIEDDKGNWIWQNAGTGRVIRQNRDLMLGFAAHGTIVDAGRHASLVLRDPKTYAIIRTIRAPKFAHHHLLTRASCPNGGESVVSPIKSAVLGFADHGRDAIATFTQFRDCGSGPEVVTSRAARINLSNGRVGRHFSVDPNATWAVTIDRGRQLALQTNPPQPAAMTIVDTTTGKTVRRYHVNGFNEDVTRDGRTAALIGTNATLEFLDMHTGKVKLGLGSTNASVIQFTPDGKTLVVGEQNGDVQLWDVATRTIAKTFAAHASQIDATAISPDGQTLYTGSYDTNVTAWNLAGGGEVAQSFSAGSLDPNLATWTLAIAPDNRTIATGTAGGDVVITDLASHRQLQRFHGGKGYVAAVSYSPDGRSLLASGEDLANPQLNWMAIWSLTPHPHLVRTFDVSDWRIITWSAWSPDGRTVAVSGFLNDQNYLKAGAVGTWDASTARPLAPPYRIKGGVVHVVTFAPNSKDIVVGGDNFQSFIADVASGKVLTTLRGSGGLGQHEYGFAYSPDGTKLASAQYDGTTRIWNPRTGRQLGKIQDPGQNAVLGVAWSPDGRTLAVSDYGPALRLYDVASLQEIGSPLVLPELPNGAGYFPWIEYTSDGKNVVVNGSNDRAFVMPVTLAAWESEACTIAGRSITRAEWAKYVPGRHYQPVCPAEG
jgi:WD40 repeat protein